MSRNVVARVALTGMALGVFIGLGTTESAGAPEPFDGTDEQIIAVTARAIDDYNKGDLSDLIAISCGRLRSDLAAANTETFAAESRSSLDDRGRGTVSRVTEIKVHESVASAAVTLPL